MDTLKSILVHADASPHTLQRLQFAARLAQRHDAAVTALYATLPVAIQYASTFALGVEIAPMMLEYESERLARARAQFDPVAAAMTPRPGWLESSGEPVYCVAQRSLCADLVVLGQRDPGSDAAVDLPVDFVEAVVIASGRPVLVLPHHPVPQDDPARVVVVAWKATREAARAATAALPLLKCAAQVHVATWQDDSAAPGEDASDIEAWLRSHGIAAVMHRRTERPDDVGDALLGLSRALGADLLVMGCYGHSRAREWVLGGATRSVLRSMHLPVLLVH